ncbi:ATP-grasp domain-containing protein [Streptomyces sp. SID8356]|uniref:ATP-grasp domain-containing protein n=1 Tax=unclassified Streptomyces TaxID=2593676 RepID=UPI0003A235CE|nr:MULTISPECIES: ATP-grasp domain-containing protein [unclassified Streptomyces]MYT40147.1 ATP-grasp domain-containing protein [Streptomyces sp. SID8356]
MNPLPVSQAAVIVDPFSSGAQYAPEFASRGIATVAVSSLPDVPAAYADSWDPALHQRILHFDGDLEHLVAELGPLSPRCVLAGAESGVELADQLTERLLPDQANVPALAAARRDKGAMDRALRAAGVPAIAQICTDDPDAVRAWIDREGLHGKDLVVKPPKSGSTDGVTRVRAGTDWRIPFDAQLGRINQWHNLNDRMLVQEYAHGTEFVVDTFSHRGRHTVADICRYGKTDNDGQMAVYESLTWVAPDTPEVPVLTRYAQAVLDAVGLRHGTAHIEIMLTADGPRLIEINCRPHGGGHPAFNLAATGDSQVHRAVRWYAGEEAAPETYRLLRHMTVLFLMARRPGTVSNTAALHGIRELTSYHHSAVRLRDGDLIEVTRDLLATLTLGFVVLAHPDPEQVAKDTAAVRAMEDALIVTPVPAPAPAPTGPGGPR